MCYFSARHQAQTNNDFNSEIKARAVFFKNHIDRILYVGVISVVLEVK